MGCLMAFAALIVAVVGFFAALADLFRQAARHRQANWGGR